MSNKRHSRVNNKSNKVFFGFNKSVSIFALLILFVVGLVSITFSSFVQTNSDNGSLIVDIRNNALSQNNKVDLADTKADVQISDLGVTMTGGEVLYLNPTVDWKLNTERYSAYFFGTGNTWVSFTYDSSSGYYKVTAPSGSWTNVIFCRMNGSTTDNSWNNKWNQTGDLVYDGTNNLYSISNGSSNIGSWSTYTPPVEPTVPELSGDTKTVYVGVITYILDEKKFTPTLHWWNDDNQIGDVDITDTGIQKDYAVGDSYWSNVAQTFHIYTAEVPVEATKYKLYKKDGDTNWANEEINNYADGKIILYWEWSGVYHQKLDDYSTNVTATFVDYNDDVLSTQTIERGATPVTPADPSRNGYNFTGWDPAVGAINTDTTFTAQYEAIKYTITYNDNEGTFSGSRPTEYYVTSDTITLPTSANMTRLGYVFGGWYDNSNCTGTAITTIPKGSTGNKVLYAKWIETNYDLTISKSSGSLDAGTITVNANGTEVIGSNGVYSIPHGSSVSVTVARTVDNNAYFSSVKVDGTSKATNLIGSFTTSFENVTAKHSVVYTLVSKPLVKFIYPTKPGVSYVSASLEYTFEGVKKTVDVFNNTSGIYVDYNTSIKYTLKLADASTSYVSGFTGVSIDTSTITATNASGSLSKVTSDVTITPTFTDNKSFTLNYVKTDDYIESIKDDLVYTLGGNSNVKLDSAQQLPYGVETTVVVQPPTGYYARIYSGNLPLADNLVSYNNGGVTFKVTVKDSDVAYSVQYLKNPTISITQPLYGSIYVTSGAGDSIQYYFDGDTVFGGTNLTVHVKADNNNSVINDVFANTTIIGYTDASTFTIFENTTASADISADSRFSFEFIEDGETYINTAGYGMRRIFFTDNNGWGDGNVVCHYASSNEDTNYEKNCIVMTYKYDNSQSQKVFYADIPINMDYVMFYKKGDTSNKTPYGKIINTNNAFYIKDDGELEYWPTPVVYSDYLATDRLDTVQQAKTAVDVPVIFSYSCDSSDEALTCRVVEGDSIEYLFSSGELTITPTTSSSGYSLVEVKSTASSTVKYYLIGVSQLKSETKRLQKIYQLNQIITLLGKFSGSAIKSIQYNISETNFPGAYELIEEINLSGQTEYPFEFNVEAKYCNGVRFFKIDVKDLDGYGISTTDKVVFGTDNVAADRLVYLYNNEFADMSKFCVRACFESAKGESWVTMQRLGDTDYYRAVVPQEYSTKVSFYLTHKNRYANIKSNEEGYTYICYYGAENVLLPQDTSYDPIYYIQDSYSDRTLKLELLQ